MCAFWVVQTPLAGKTAQPAPEAAGRSAGGEVTMRVNHILELACRGEHRARMPSVVKHASAKILPESRHALHAP